MGEATGISWADHTFNPWIGCTRLSPACDGCYADAMMGEAGRYKRAVWGGPGAGEGTRVRTSTGYWKQPLRWDRAARDAGLRPFVFCASLADVFDNAVDPQWRADLFELILETPQLVWLLLTKRPQNIVRMVKVIGHMPPNIAFGATVEDEKRKRQNLPPLMVAGGLRPIFLFVSFEPLLEDVGDLSPWLPGSHDGATRDAHPQVIREGQTWSDGHRIDANGWPQLPAIGWAITGGETDQGGHKARPINPEWVRSIRDQCARHGVPFHHKQNGEWAPGEIVCASGARGVVPVAWAESDGSWTHGAESLSANDGHIDDEPTVYRIGKRRTGRWLDGVVHDARPLSTSGFAHG